jgi:hypothetical protein
MTSSPTLSRRHLFLLPAALLPVAAAHGRATPGASPVAAPDENLKIAAMLPELPSITSDAKFARSILEPDAEIATREASGTILLLLRSGGVTLDTDLPVVYRRAGETGPAEAAGVPSGGITLRPGEGALVPDTMGMTLANTGTEPADLLALEIVPRTADASGERREPGAARQSLGEGPLTFHAGPAVTIVEQVVVKPGHSAYSTTFRGVEMGVIERGGATVLARAGMTWSTPGLLDGAELAAPGTDPVEAGAWFNLQRGDGYASYDGSLVWQAADDEPLVILRAQVIPVPQPGR